MHWTLDQLRDLTVDEFSELVGWLKDKSERHDESVDMDAVLDAKRAKERAQQDGDG